jgi:hypothetical protein
MKKLSLMSLPLLLIMASLCTIVSAAAPVYINNVGLMPDWQQPNAPLPFGNLPGYSNWCSPTAVANAFGWWEDAKGAVGLTDRKLFPATNTAPPAGSPLVAYQWNERLWQDGTVELGWYMDTGQWASGATGFPNVLGTLSPAIGPGGVTYAQTAWNDMDGITPVNKLTFPNASVSTYSFNDPLWTPLKTWNDYKSGIDSGLPVVVSWETWVNPDTERLLEGDIYTYGWADVSGLGHTTTGIGYIDPNPNLLGDEWIIVHDDWSTTQENVAMPLWLNPGVNWSTYWRQDDLFLIPEPATIMLLGLGGLLLRRKR